MILGADSRKKWNHWDRLLMEAYQGVLRERCPQCGLPVWLCHNDDGDIGFKVVETLCYAVKELEMVDERKTASKNYKAPKGVKARPEAFTYSGAPLDGAIREAYFEAEYKRSLPKA